MSKTAFFYECFQFYQNRGTEENRDDKLRARVAFFLNISGNAIPMAVEFWQPEGYNWDQPQDFPVQMELPAGHYSGVWNYQSLKIAVEDYYRRAVGSQGNFIRIQGSATVLMGENRIQMARFYEFEVSDAASGQPNSWQTAP